MVYDLYAAQRAAVTGGAPNPFMGLPSSGGRPMPMMTPSGAGTPAPVAAATIPTGTPQPMPQAAPPALPSYGGLDLSFMTPANRAAVMAQLSGQTTGGAIGPQPFGSTGGSPEGTSVAGRGGVHSGAEGAPETGGGVPNTGGFGMSPAESVASRGEGVMGSFASSNPGISLGGNLGVESGFNASAGLTGLSGGMDVGPSALGGFAIGPSLGGFAGPPSAGFGAFASPDVGAQQGFSAAAVAAAQSLGAQATQAALDAGMSPQAAAAIGQGATAAALGGGDTSGGGGYGGEGMGIGLGGVADGSSNAGIGGPAGTGAVGGAGDAGQGTGGPGEGDQYGGHFTVGGVPGLPDNMNVRLRATPGEHVTVTPPGVPPSQILRRPEQPTQWQMHGGNPFMGLPGRR